MGSLKYNPDVNPRDFEINHLLPWIGPAQIFHSTFLYSISYKYLLQLFLQISLRSINEQHLSASQLYLLSTSVYVYSCLISSFDILKGNHSATLQCLIQLLFNVSFSYFSMSHLAILQCLIQLLFKASFSYSSMSHSATLQCLIQLLFNVSFNYSSMSHSATLQCLIQLLFNVSLNPNVSFSCYSLASI